MSGRRSEASVVTACLGQAYAVSTLRPPCKRLFYLSTIAIFGYLAGPNKTSAKPYDLKLSSLARYDQASQSVVADRGAFRSLSSQLGTVVAPKAMDPADSLGLSGFALTADVALHSIDHRSAYWVNTTDAKSLTPFVSTLSVMGRKGLWPGLELGAGATKLFQSRMWSLNGYAKFALHEGFHHLPIPSIAARVMYGYLLGSRTLNMHTVSGDITLSHSFGIRKTLHLTPYLGYQMLGVISRSDALDLTPAVDEYPDGFQDAANCGPNDPCPPNEFEFERQRIVRHRPFVGARIIFGVYRLGVEAMFASAGSSEQRIAGQTAVDKASFQQQYTLSLGLDF